MLREVDFLIIFFSWGCYSMVDATGKTHEKVHIVHAVEPLNHEIGQNGDSWDGPLSLQLVCTPQIFNELDSSHIRIQHALHITLEFADAKEPKLAISIPITVSTVVRSPMSNDLDVPPTYESVIDSIALPAYV